MIRYPISRTELEVALESEKSGWLQRARDRTDSFRAQGKYEEGCSIWSEVKAVYMRIQKGKCAYCEREMESIKFGKVEQDVEHFRPKGSIKAWKPPVTLKSIPFTPVSKNSQGYHLLPYHVFNYAAACKPCNSILKKDYFPIAGTYQLDADDPNALSSEQAYLIYPLGDMDDDPESLIDFHGASPKAIPGDDHSRDRALVTIEFFKLDDPNRKSIYRDRAFVILALYPLLQNTTRGTVSTKLQSKREVDLLLQLGLRHLNCARSFRRLFEKDPTEAKAVYEAAKKFLGTVS